MKKSIKKLSIFGLSFLLISLFSCDSDYSKQPYLVTKPECCLATTFSTYEYAGINFEFVNNSNKTLSSIEVSLMIFDAKTGKNPFKMSNLIFAKVDKQMLAKERASFEISLDEYVTDIPTEPYLVEHFSINKVYYTDGSVYKQMPIAPMIYCF